MENMKTPSPEELQKLLEKAQREAREAMEKLSPEERAQAEARAKQMMEEDRASMQALMDEAARVAAGVTPRAKTTPKFCPHCGTPVSGGKFCTNCGGSLL